MNKSLLVIIITIISFNIHAQDLLTFKDGSVKSVNVKEISETELKYQKIDNTSVIYSVLKTSLFSVQFKNGQTEVFNQSAAVVPQNVVAPLIASQSKNVVVSQPQKVPKQETGISVPIVQPFVPKPATLTFKDGSTKMVTIKDITEMEVKYEKSGNKNTIYAVLKTDLLSVQYKNGEKVNLIPTVVSQPIKKEPIVENTSVQKIETIVQEKSPKQQIVSENTVLTKREYSDMFQQGRNDAKIYYKGYKGAGTGTFFAALLTGPIFALIPAIACSSTAPSSDNLTFPSVELMRNPDYVSGYTTQAKAKKSGKVWGNYGIGTAILLVVLASQVKR